MGSEISRILCFNTPTFQNRQERRHFIGTVFSLKYLNLHVYICANIFGFVFICFANCLLIYFQETQEQKGTGCEFCGKVYFNRGNLVRHKRSVHMGIYPHKCETCGKGFSNKDNLNGHVFLHTGQMAYVCLICDAQFQWKPTLELHMKKVHAKW